MSSAGAGISTFVIRWINFLTLKPFILGFCYLLLVLFTNCLCWLFAMGVIGFGVWMSSHHDNCRKPLTLPVIGLGAVIFVVSIIGFLGALKRNSILLWIYLILLCLILVATLVFTVLAFIVTNNGSGHNVTGLRYREYQLHDYSSWFLKHPLKKYYVFFHFIKLNNTHNWEHLRSCLVKSADCNNLAKKYKTLKQFKLAKLSPIEAGCCRPPSECGYPTVNASFYDLSFHPMSSNKDCIHYKNSKAIKCYNCDSCKAGVAQYMKTEWRVVAVFNVVLFVVLSMIYFIGCCARRNAARSNYKV
ncbi:Tetraspanin-10 [Orobanche hederae]